MSILKKAIWGDKYENVGNKGIIKKDVKKLNKLEEEFLAANQSMSQEDYQKKFQEAIDIRKQASDEECLEKGYKNEIKIRRNSLDKAKAKYNAENNGFAKKYNKAESKTKEETCEILELKQKIDILVGWMK